MLYNMELMKKCFLTALTILSLIYAVFSIFRFTRFLSDFSTIVHANLSTSTRTSFEDPNNTTLYTAEALVVDISLLCVFIIVHSSLIPIQEMVSTVMQLPVLSRTIYILINSATLQLLVHMWMPIPQHTLWTVDTQQVFLGVHIVSWVLIYVMMITMDITDLLGVKQVYYYMTGRPVPAKLKSETLKHLHKKMRHPSFLGLATIFWIFPCMRLDRLLLASAWSLYMLLVWRPDTFSYNYLVQQNVAKRSVL